MRLELAEKERVKLNVFGQDKISEAMRVHKTVKYAVKVSKPIHRTMVPYVIANCSS